MACFFPHSGATGGDRPPQIRERRTHPCATSGAGTAEGPGAAFPGSAAPVRSVLPAVPRHRDALILGKTLPPATVGTVPGIGAFVTLPALQRRDRVRWRVQPARRPPRGAPTVPAG